MAAGSLASLIALAGALVIAWFLTRAASPHLAGLAAGDRRVMTTARGYSRRLADRLVAYIGAKAKLAGQLGLETLIVTLKQREAERDQLRRELLTLDRAGKAAQLDPKTIERELRAKLADWRNLLRKHVPQARQVLKKLLAGPLVFTPVRNGWQRYYEFKAPIAVGRIISGLACATMVASPRGVEEGRQQEPATFVAGIA